MSARCSRIGSLILGLVMATGVFAVLAYLSPMARTAEGNGVSAVTSNDVLAAVGASVVEPGSQSSPAQITASFDWSGPTFPGVHRCTIDAIAPSGDVVGSYADEVVALKGSAEFTVPIDVTQPAASATASCDPHRVDIGEPYAYSFDVVGVENDRGRAYVTFLHKWLGSGSPGAVTCEVTVLARDGENMSSQTTHFYLGVDGEESRAFLPLVDTTADPASATITGCRPFEG